MREIKFRAWNKVTGMMVDLKKLTPFMVDAGKQDGLFIPFDGYIELMQYTGLKDKNGKEIYEGDIVIDSEGDLIDVIWNYQLLHYLSDVVADQLEVIGNVFENPELLEK